MSRPGERHGERTLRMLLEPLADWLSDPATTEVCVNRPGEVFVERRGAWERHEVSVLDFARLDAIAKLLDVAFVVPGTNIRYGIDGLIGLVPVIGDIITTAFSLWLVREARALGAPWHITARMLSNVAVDGAVGLVPVAGDAFDVMFRANVRNVRMFRRWLERQPR